MQQDEKGESKGSYIEDNLQTDARLDDDEKGAEAVMRDWPPADEKKIL
jgi:hypothetical protein